MSCQCLENIRKKLEEHHKTSVDMELKMFVHRESMEMGMGLPPLRYSYMEGKKRKKSYVTFNYCPFCGKKET